MVCLEKMLNFDDFTSLNFSYILGTGIRLLLCEIPESLSLKTLEYLTISNLSIHKFFEIERHS